MLHIMVILAFILGFSNAFVFIPSNTILQEETAMNARENLRLANSRRCYSP